MSRTSLVIFVLSLVIFTFLSFTGMGDLPEKIAIHFNVSGSADAWAPREVYRVVFFLCLIGFPLFLVSVMAGLPRLARGKGQIPDRHFLLRHACWLGTLTVAFIYGIHITVIRANAINPPLLAIDRLLVLVFVYLAILAWWVIVFLRHFKQTD